MAASVAPVHRGLIRSVATLAYEEAQAAIDGTPRQPDRPLLGSVKPLYAAYEACVKRARDARHPLDLDLPERRIELTPDGRVDRVIVQGTARRPPADRGIHDPRQCRGRRELDKGAARCSTACMTSRASRRCMLCARLRKTLGHPLAQGAARCRPSLFNRVLAQVSGDQDLSRWSTRSCCARRRRPNTSGELRPFRTDLRRYAHFTSPIRRYADLDRASRADPPRGCGKAACRRETASICEDTAQHLAHRAARHDGRTRDHRSPDRTVTSSIASAPSFQGRISGVTRSGLFVKLNDTGADGLIPIRTLGTEYFNYDETRHALVGTRSGAMHRLGDVVDVRLVEAQPVAGALRFELLSEGQGIPRGRNQDRFTRGRAKEKPKERPGRSPREKTRKPEKKRSGEAKKGKSWRR